MARLARQALARRRVRLLRSARADRGDDCALGGRGLPRRAEGLRSSNALVAWLDGAAVDDGTACEIGMFAQLVAGGDPRYVGIVGIATDLRLERSRGALAGDGLNLFLGGVVSAYGRLCWSVDEAIETLASWRTGGR